MSNLTAPQARRRTIARLVFWSPILSFGIWMSVTGLASFAQTAS